MAETTRALLRRSLVDRYPQLKDRLTRKLGSDALANEALHETWLRLGQGGELGPVADAEAYLYRAALNTASNLRITSARHSHGVELGDIHDVADSTPGPDRIAEGQAELGLLRQALAELPARQREAFTACFMGATSPEALAKRYGVSVRTIQADIRSVVIHCARRLGRKDILADSRVRLSRK